MFKMYKWYAFILGIVPLPLSSADNPALGYDPAAGVTEALRSAIPMTKLLSKGQLSQNNFVLKYEVYHLNKGKDIVFLISSNMEYSLNFSAWEHGQLRTNGCYEGSYSSWHPLAAKITGVLNGWDMWRVDGYEVSSLDSDSISKTKMIQIFAEVNVKNIGLVCRLQVHQACTAELQEPPQARQGL